MDKIDEEKVNRLIEEISEVYDLLLNYCSKLKERRKNLDRKGIYLLHSFEEEKEILIRQEKVLRKQIEEILGKERTAMIVLDIPQ